MTCWVFEDYHSHPVVQECIPDDVTEAERLALVGKDPRTLRDIEILHHPYNGRGVRIRPHDIFNMHSCHYTAYWLDAEGKTHSADIDHETHEVLLVLQ